MRPEDRSTRDYHTVQDGFNSVHEASQFQCAVRPLVISDRFGRPFRHVSDCHQIPCINQLFSMAYV